MKTIKLLPFIFPLFLINSCEKNNPARENRYVFIKPYCAVVTVGGFVGISEKCFVVGDTVSGNEITEGQIAIRIAAHSKINEGPPSPSSYQEFLYIPAENLVKILD